MRFLVDPITYMMRLYREHGPVAGFTDGENKHLLFMRHETPPSRPTFFAFSPEANHDLLTDTDLFAGSAFTGPDTPAFKNLSSNHIFAAFGDRHRQQRRLIMPAFHKKRVESYRDDMVRYTEQIPPREVKRASVRGNVREMVDLPA